MNRNNNVRVPRRRRHGFGQAGFTLISLMIVCAIIAILTALAIPNYIQYTVKTHRVAAEGCLSEYANYMERFYTTNLRYDQATDGTKNVLPDLNCAKGTATGGNYTYQFVGGSPTATTYVIEAIPENAQAARDTKCATLTLDATGARTESGSGTLEQCW